MNRRTRKRLTWLALGASAVILSLIGGAFPQAVEYVYGGIIYPAIRWLFRYTLGMFPAPAIWVVVVLSLWLLYATAIRPLRQKNWSWRSLVSGVLSTCGALVFLFYLLWGFNYGRPGVAERLGLEAPPMAFEELQEEFQRATDSLVSWMARHQGLVENERSLLPPSLHSKLHNGLEPVLSSMGLTIVATPRARLLKPKGSLLVFNTAGIYIPFAGEGHVDAGMLPVQIPFTMAHELAHGYGVTDEGECNFIAYLVCLAASDPQIRFSGLLSYWRYVASDYRRADPEAYKESYETLPELLKTILLEIRENNDRYPEIMPQFRDRVYDSYLKSHGVREGLGSYSTVVRLVRAYREAGE